MNSASLAALIDAMRFQCRLRELAFLDPLSSPERVARIEASLERLGSGRFVIGLGPSCQEVVRIGRHPVRFGRHASLLESPHPEIVDVAVNDAALHGPREVSRLHCTINQGDDDSISIVDEGSSTGTWVHPSCSRLESHTPARIQSGTMFSLGPSGTNMFMYVKL